MDNYIEESTKMAMVTDDYYDKKSYMNYEVLKHIEDDLNNKAKSRFVSIADVYDSLGFEPPYSCDSYDQGWACDKKGNSHLVFRLYNTPFNRQKYEQNIVTEDDMYVYITQYMKTLEEDKHE